MRDGVIAVLPFSLSRHIQLLRPAVVYVLTCFAVFVLLANLALLNFVCLVVVVWLVVVVVVVVVVVGVVGMGVGGIVFVVFVVVVVVAAAAIVIVVDGRRRGRRRHRRRRCRRCGIEVGGQKLTRERQGAETVMMNVDNVMKMVSSDHLAPTMSAKMIESTATKLKQHLEGEKLANLLLTGADAMDLIARMRTGLLSVTAAL